MGKIALNCDMTYSESLLFAKCCLHLDGIWVVIGNEPPVSAHTLGGASPLVDLLFGASSWQRVIFEGAVISSAAPVFVTGPIDMQETSPKQGDPQEYLLCRHARSHNVLNARGA